MEDEAGGPAGLFMPFSSYSFLRGTASPAELAAWARRAGYPGLALADMGNLYALPLAVEAARAEGRKLLAAARIPWEGRVLFSAIALDREGYGLLCDILSRRFSARDAWLGGRMGGEDRPRGGGIDDEADEDAGIAAGLLAELFPPPPGDPLDWVLEAGGRGLALLSVHQDVLVRLRAGGCADVYGELPAGLPFRALARFCAREGLEPMAVNAALTRDSLDILRWKLLRCSATRLSLFAFEAGLAEAAGRPWYPESAALACLSEDLPELPPDPSWGFRDAEEMRSLFSALPEALVSAGALLEAAEPAEAFLSPRPVFPPYEPPLDGGSSLEGSFGPPLAEADAQALLARLCRQGISGRYGPGGEARVDVAQRLERELGVIGAKGFASYFLVVRDIVLSCPRTCGRGSAASSIVAYLLRLTHVDPLEHDLFFERFLNEGRSDPPDIDIDFPWDERATLLARVFRRYRGRSGMVADHCTFRRRGALREAALASGASDEEAAAWAGLMELGRWDEIPIGPRRSAELLRGLPRYLGTHPGGVVIVPGRLADYVHCQPSRAGYPVIAWEKEGAEAAGLVKIDLLGNRSLAVLRDCIELCRPRLGGDRRAEWGDFSVTRDARVRAMIERGDTLGVFYVESPATRALLRKMGEGDYAHLVAASSIIRPAANKWIDEYVVRMKTGAWERLPAAVEDALRETYGVMVYQEDVARVAIAAAGFDSAKADRLRKALTKKDRLLRVAQLKEDFQEGARARGCAEADIARMWEMMLSFDGYSFCKAHSASYALVSYKLAYFKARLPVEFLCCVINNGGGFYARQVYVDEARRRGARILPPRVCLSADGYSVEQRADGGRDLRAGLSQVKGLSAVLRGRILEARAAGGPFRSAEDFFRRARPRADEARALVLAGALDGLPAEEGGEGLSRPALLWAWEAWRLEDEREGEGAGRGPGGGQEGYSPAAAGHFAAGGLFAAEPGALTPGLGPPGDYSRTEKLAHEAAGLGLLLSRHPLDCYAERARRAAARLGLPEPVDSRRLPELVGAEVAIAGTAAAGKEVLTRGGKAMCFRSFEDGYGFFEAVLFPQVYDRLLPVLESNRAFLVIGLVQNDLGSLSLEVRDVIGLSRRR